MEEEWSGCCVGPEEEEEEEEVEEGDGSNVHSLFYLELLVLAGQRISSLGSPSRQNLIQLALEALRS
jgi:hypothetical protein